MKFFYAKRDIQCKYCPGVITRGQFYLRTNYKNSTTGRYYSFPYHYECYKEYFLERLDKDALYFKGEMELPKKLGRPKKYWNSKLADRLRALIYYHKKAGNDEKVQELQAKLDKLRA